MRLYGISDAEVELAVDRPDATTVEGDRTVALKLIPGRFSGLPLKVVYTMEGENVVVVTAYPLKRGYRR